MIKKAELDHVVMFVESEEKARAKALEAGLKINASRSHKGQGTSNICAFLDDMFIEFIWLDGTPICQESERVTIGERGRGAGLPLGVSWRGDFSVECSPYRAPYLPDGVSIPVLQASLDIAMPLVFGSPFGVPPAERTGDRFAIRQLPNVTALHNIKIGLKNPDPVSGALNGIEKSNWSETLTKMWKLQLWTIQGTCETSSTGNCPMTELERLTR